MSGYWYLATSYSRNPVGLLRAYKMALEATVGLMKAGHHVYSPIVHNHPVETAWGADPLDHAGWMAFDAPLMAGASGLLVLMAGEWERSKGVGLEIKAFHDAGKPIFFLEPGKPPLVFIPAPLRTFLYRNHRGIVSERHVYVSGMRQGKSEFYQDEQWLVGGFDLDRMDFREFSSAIIEEMNGSDIDEAA
jgi:hypothetical protein